MSTSFSKRHRANPCWPSSLSSSKPRFARHALFCRCRRGHAIFSKATANWRYATMLITNVSKWHRMKKGWVPNVRSIVIGNGQRWGHVGLGLQNHSRSRIFIWNKIKCFFLYSILSNFSSFLFIQKTSLGDMQTTVRYLSVTCICSIVIELDGWILGSLGDAAHFMSNQSFILLCCCSQLCP